MAYILTEIWRARESWGMLTPAERTHYFETKINPFLGAQLDAGAEVLACAVNDNMGPERIDFSFMAVWKLPSKNFSENLEAGAKAAGFLNYFEQVNFSGNLIDPPKLNDAMVNWR